MQRNRNAGRAALLDLQRCIALVENFGARAEHVAVFVQGQPMDNAQLCGRTLGDHRNGVALGAGDGCNPRVDSPLSAVAVYLDARVAEKSGAKLRRQGDRRLLGHSGLRLLAGSQQRQHVRRR